MNTLNYAVIGKDGDYVCDVDLESMEIHTRSREEDIPRDYLFEDASSTKLLVGILNKLFDTNALYLDEVELPNEY